MASFRPRNLADFGGIIWRRKWVIVLLTAAFLKATLMVIQTMPNLYESRAQLAVLTKPADDMQSLGAQIAALSQRALSRENLEPLIKRYQLGRPNEDVDNVVARLRKQIKVEVKLREYYPQFPEQINISFRHPEPKIAHGVVSEMVAQFTQTNEQLRQQAATEIKRLEEELADLEAPLGKIAHQRNAARNPLVNNAPPTEDPRLLRRQLLSEINVLSDKQYALERQIQMQTVQITEQQTLAKTAPIASGPVTSGSYGVLLAKRAELEATIKEYARQYTEENPKMRQARLQLEQLNQQIAQMEKPAATAAAPGAAVALTPEGRELRTMQRELEKLKTEQEIAARELERKRQMLAALPEPVAPVAAVVQQIGTDAAADVEYERLSKRYQWLLDRQDALQQAQANLNIGPNLNLFRVIDPPFLPKVPVAPNFLMLKLIGLGIALGVALFIIGVTESRSFFRIYDERDVEYYLGAPVVGLIPETLTPVETSRARVQKWGKVVLIVLLAAAAIPVFEIILTQTGLIQMLAAR